MKITILTILAFIFLSLSPSIQAQEVNQQFSKDLKQLKEYFHIPGMAVLVEKDGEIIYEDYFGFANIQDSIEVNQNTAFPIASLTKIFSGILLMKAKEEGKLSLETPINEFLNRSKLGDSVRVKHILTHTSQGDLGENFYYSYRFGLLTPVIEKTYQNKFQEVVSTEIFGPLEMNDSWFLNDSTETKARDSIFAKPYLFDESTTPGPVEYGVSTSSGIVSTASDLLKLSHALDNRSLLSNASMEFMFSAPKEDLPYGHGIFAQDMNGIKLIWGYGQYDAYSSLFLKVPERNSTLILLANNNLMSDPARLIYGDASSSLFALSFLKNYIFHTVSPPSPLLIRKQLLAQALACSFMSRFEDTQWNKSIELLEIVFETYPNYLEYGDLNLLHNLMFLKTVAFHKEFGEFNRFDDKIEGIANQLHSKDPLNPYVNVYLGDYHSSKGNVEKAKLHYKNIVDSKNFSPFWYTGVAKNWLENNP
ncbi:serine hydrolase domain-containing protein [Flagellimonas sp.]|uniref:serine hydrolase domain-containing protein n=1 Tax=Flagellimonas sp. TaxID=2058762 RepID=UPI003F49E159